MANKDSNKKEKKKKEHVLTEKEKKRLARVADITADYEARGYRRKDVIVSIAAANILAFVYTAIFAAIMCFWFYRHNGNTFMFGNRTLIWTGIVFLLLIPVHEGLHGITWGAFAPGHYRVIEFGFMKETATPYCYCGEALTRGVYILGSIMPCLILGIIPAIAGVYLNSTALLTLGIFGVMGAGGDLTIIGKMLLYKSDAKATVLMDHPIECGFIVFEK